MQQELQNPRTKDENSAWSSTPEIEAQVKEARQAIEKATAAAKNRIIPSPEDGSPSRFVRYEGAHGRAVAVFRSETGHEFFMS